jgi:peptidoglycan/LPS O-acetylase OafA/YrhL
MSQVTSAATRRQSDTFLRGLAICCVVIIHFLSSFKKSPFITGAELQNVAVAIDQLGRVAVPLFVALSGHGLMLRYCSAKFEWREFLKKRVFKLLPLYIVWSYIYWFVFLFIPEWRPTAEMKPFFGQLLFGNADYHLYFVPMIFQLYLLFPLVLSWVKKRVWLTLGAAALFQVAFFYIVSTKMNEIPGSTFFQSDQKQYVWFFTWILYFVLGMSMTYILPIIKRIEWGTWFTYLTTVVVGIWVTASALHAINTGVDPLVALRFTRIEILIYCVSCIVSLFLVVDRNIQFSKIMLLFGTHSYLIYLGHTLLLRALFLFINPPVGP